MISKCVFRDIKTNENCMYVVNLMLREIARLNSKFHNLWGDSHTANVMKFCSSVKFGFYIDNMLYRSIMQSSFSRCIQIACFVCIPVQTNAQKLGFGHLSSQSFNFMKYIYEKNM